VASLSKTLLRARAGNANSRHCLNAFPGNRWEPEIRIGECVYSRLESFEPNGGR
jgi:hypothetical protein